MVVGCQRLGLFLGRGALLVLKLMVIGLVVGSMCLTVTSGCIFALTMLAILWRTWV